MTAPTSTRVRWYGRILETDRDFALRLPVGEGAPSATLRREDADASNADRSLYRSRPRDESGPWLEVFGGGPTLRIHFSGIGDFALSGDEIRYRWEDGASSDAEVYFLGLVSALWLERKGAICLHASAVALPAGVVGFLGFNRAGKSSLAAGFLALGYSLVTDDVLALERVDESGIDALPSFPQMRLWPSSAKTFVDDAEALEPIHPDFEKRRVPIGGNGLGAFSDRIEKLSALFVLNRGSGTKIETERISPREALIEMVRHSFLGTLGEVVVGVEPRFERLVGLAEAVPAFRLSYPHGLDLLPSVCQAIADCVSSPVVQGRGFARRGTS